MTRRIAVVHGPNLNALGRREPEIYGSTTLAELDLLIAGWARELGV
ncbi:MAG TPA: type II 3-dehydroquinate dehydratase, partial [Actinobacteria bacterium]|nr:type II 3-dehydroquinate dehydratase [Actinomycetota bacterium]